MDDKEIRCTCGKVLLKITPDGKIKAWCKRCKKEIEVEVDKEKEKRVCYLCGGTGNLPTGFYGGEICSLKDQAENRFPEICRVCNGSGYTFE